MTERAESSGRFARILSRAGVSVLRTWRRFFGVWQRSLQLRVITATLALSVAVVSLLGITLMRQIEVDLLEQQKDASTQYAGAGIFTAQQVFNSLAGNEIEAGRRDAIISDLAAVGGQQGPHIVLLRPASSESTTQLARTSPQVVGDTIADELRLEVEQDPSHVWLAYTTIEFENGVAPEPGIVVGGQVQTFTGTATEQYGLYYVFSLSETERTLTVIRTGLWTAGLLVVLLLAAIAGLVTRQVVTPVRMAAKIADRFSVGNLSERMAVRGSDDISRLATSFNQMAHSLQEQIGELEDLSRVQQQFASDVSHELRTPLTTVRMAADVLHESRDDFDPVVRRSAELLQAQLDRFEVLLSDLLEISRFDAGVAILNAGDVDLRDLVYTVTESASQLAARKGSEVVVRVPEEACMAEIDSRRIERVLRNLVVNAIEHGEGNQIVVTVGANDQAVAVGVRDYGVGLKPGETSLVFHRFWRADPARARTTGGTGLGLAISLEDARLHGGWLRAWGEPGAGSQFLLTLPRTANADITSSPLPLMPTDASYDRTLAGVGSPYRRVSGGLDGIDGSDESGGVDEVQFDDPVSDDAPVELADATSAITPMTAGDVVEFGPAHDDAGPTVEPATGQQVADPSMEVRGA